VPLMVANVVVPKTEIPELVNEDAVAAPHENEVTVVAWNAATPRLLMVAHVNALAVAPKLVAPVMLRVVADMVKKVATPVEPTVITLAEALPIVSD